MQPYFMWGIETEPGIYFFVTDIPSAGGGSPLPEVDYVGQAEVVCRRVRFGRHHRLAGDYRPTRYLYIPLLGANALDLTAAENLFIHLYKPRLNQDHMPRIGLGDLTRWSKRLVDCMNRRQHEALYRFLARPDPEYPDSGQRVAVEITRALGGYLSQDDQMLIVRGLLAGR
jgi:hypothetical protein